MSALPEREIEVCLGCESRGPSGDLDSDGLCAECREMTHISLVSSDGDEPRKMRPAVAKAVEAGLHALKGWR